MQIFVLTVAGIAVLSSCSSKSTPDSRGLQNQQANQIPESSLVSLDEKSVSALSADLSSYVKRSKTLSASEMDQIDVIQIDFLLPPDSPLVTATEKERHAKGLSSSEFIYEDEGGRSRSSHLFYFKDHGAYVRQEISIVPECGNGRECDGLTPPMPRAIKSSVDSFKAIRDAVRDIEYLPKESLSLLPQCSFDYQRGSIKRFRVYLQDRTYTDVWFARSCLNQDGTMGTIHLDAVTWARDVDIDGTAVNDFNQIKQKEWEHSFEYLKLRQDSLKEIQKRCKEGDESYCQCVNKI